MTELRPHSPSPRTRRARREEAIDVPRPSATQLAALRRMRGEVKRFVLDPFTDYLAAPRSQRTYRRYASTIYPLLFDLATIGLEARVRRDREEWIVRIAADIPGTDVTVSEAGPILSLVLYLAVERMVEALDLAALRLDRAEKRVLATPDVTSAQRLTTSA